MASLDNLFDSLTSGGSFKKSKVQAKTQKHKDGVSSLTEKQKKKRNNTELNFFGSEEDLSSSKPTKKHVKPQEKAEEEISSPKTPASNQVRDEETAAFRRRMMIKVEGDGCPAPIATFEELPFEEKGCRVKRGILEGIEQSTWKEPTPVQMQSVPALHTGRDVVVSAPTGSGKTAAFLLPAFIKLSTKKMKEQASKSKDFSPRVLLVAPTRELANQIHREALALAAGTTIGVQLLTKARASTLTSSYKSAFNGILVSTPMRLVASLRSGDFKLNSVELVVLDEADRLFELGRDEQVIESDGNSTDVNTGFLGQIDEVLAACDNGHIQRALFSATMGDQVRSLVDTVLRDPLRVSIGLVNAGANTIEQRLVFVGREEGKLLAFRQLIQEGLRPPVLVFLQSKERAKELYNELVFDGINVDIIHSDRTLDQRDAVIKNFRLGKVWVLLCTDLLGRGVDFKGLNMVVNYDFPTSAVSYIHRIGRTGRAGREGLAVTFFTEGDMPMLRPIANVIKLSGGKVADWMLSLNKKERRDVKRRREQGAPPARDAISTSIGYQQHNKMGKGRGKGKGKGRGKGKGKGKKN